jgi:lipid-A-disaccharide synthase
VTKDRAVYIGIVAGEASGDLLGAELIREIRKVYPQAMFEGICGPKMQEAGCHALYDMESISLMGFDHLLEKFREILRIRKQLVRRFVENGPDLFIGVDVPDFNISLEGRLKAVGIPTVHYVSPTVWAWRGYRIRKIGRSVDHMLTLFPFEEEYYREHGVPVTFVGHPMADQIPDHIDKEKYRQQLKIPRGRIGVAMLPGSRRSEIKRLAPLFIRTAQLLSAQYNNLQFIFPFVSETHKDYFAGMLRRMNAEDLPLTTIVGKSREAMSAADMVLLASGTAALEAALLQKPMVVTYKVSWLSYMIIRWFAHVSLYSMPNNLAGYELVPELIQSDATAEKLAAALEAYLEKTAPIDSIRGEFQQMHQSLKRNASRRAAEVVISMLRKQEIGA